jgi:hypothetical protein
MSLDLDLEPIAPEPRNASVLERLRAERAADADDHYDLVVPLWSGDLQVIARFLRIPWRGRVAQSFDKLARSARGRASNTTAAELHALCDLLVLGLDQLFYRDGADAPLVPLEHEDGAPMKFDVRTAEALQLPAGSAREAVLSMFGGDRGEFRLRAAGEEYFAWLRDVEVVSEDEGNS